MKQRHASDLLASSLHAIIIIIIIIMLFIIIVDASLLLLLTNWLAYLLSNLISAFFAD